MYSSLCALQGVYCWPRKSSEAQSLLLHSLLLRKIYHLDVWIINWNYSLICGKRLWMNYIQYIDDFVVILKMGQNGRETSSIFMRYAYFVRIITEGEKIFFCKGLGFACEENILHSAPH